MGIEKAKKKNIYISKMESERVLFLSLWRKELRKIGHERKGRKE